MPVGSFPLWTRLLAAGRYVVVVAEAVVAAPRAEARLGAQCRLAARRVLAAVVVEAVANRAPAVPLGPVDQSVRVALLGPVRPRALVVRPVLAEAVHAARAARRPSQQARGQGAPAAVALAKTSTTGARRRLLVSGPDPLHADSIPVA